MKNSGFTLIEMALVLFLITLVIGIGFFMATGRQFVSDVLQTEVYEIIDELRTAQFESMFGQSGNDYTVHFTPTQMAISPSGTVVNFDDVTLTNILLGGGNDVVFSHQLGNAAPSGTIKVTGPNNATRTITISASGAITWSIP